jgi:hypothetical protein
LVCLETILNISQDALVHHHAEPTHSIESQVTHFPSSLAGSLQGYLGTYLQLTIIQIQFVYKSIINNPTPHTHKTYVANESCLFQLVFFHSPLLGISITGYLSNMHIPPLKNKQTLDKLLILNNPVADFQLCDVLSSGLRA